MKKSYWLILLLLPLSYCISTKTSDTMEKGIRIAHLAKNDTKGFAQIKNSFKNNNPGYDLYYFHQTKQIPSHESNRVLFLQEGGGTATLSNGQSSKFSVGDIIMLDKAASLSTDSLFSALVFSVPDTPPTNIPSFIRPDWDSNITDTPGGCATATNAYRRILLTWKDKVGPYLFHSINAHRVRITDSFSHYHPQKGGFDEFYLVQMVQPTARIITSNQVNLIENPLSINKKQAKNLIQETALATGDLIYLPRGLMHRGIGGVLAQVITVPGFIPGSEIGVDHHLKKINNHLNLKGKNRLPLNEEASKTAIIK
jgi:hypothetical protein